MKPVNNQFNGQVRNQVYDKVDVPVIIQVNEDVITPVSQLVISRYVWDTLMPNITD